MKGIQYVFSVIALVAGFALSAQSADIPVGGPNSQTAGVFGAVFTWPIIGIHAVLLPNGRVFSYGTDEQGRQGGQFVYDIWDPTQGTGALAHTVLPNTTGTDIFCSGQSIIRATGEVLITGGDLTVNGQRNYSNDRTTIFNPQVNTISAGSPMLYARWYPSVIPLTNGEMLILGGRDAPGTATTPTPEVYNPATGWRTLWNASSDLAFGNDPLQAWYYPRAWQAPNGQVFVWGHDGNLFYMSPAGDGALTQLTQTTPESWNYMPALMYAPGKVMSMRYAGKVVVIDINGQQPVVTEIAPLSQARVWSNATVVADGKVLVTGGSSEPNQLINVAYLAEIWDPATGRWTRGATAAKARLYHSTALLLPDATVLTMGGGASDDSPVNNLNGEIYYPSYLYKQDGSGLPAPRPTIVSAPATAQVGQPLVAIIGSTAPIGGVTMVRTASVTHSFDADQRYLPLTFTQSGQTVAATIPADPDIALPGYYLLFVLDQAGVPSVAKVVQVVL